MTVTTRRLQAAMKRVVENIWRTTKKGSFSCCHFAVFWCIVAVFDLRPDMK